MSILGKIKKGVANSGSNKGKIIFIKADSKVRIRFLVDMEDGLEVTMHDSFEKGVNALCLEHIGESCENCDDESLRHRQAYAWPVWDYDAKEVKIFLGYANNFNPLPNLVACCESYGTLLDRDYVLQRDGSGTNSRYSVVAMDKVKFKNPKAKPFTKKKVLEILAKAYPANEDVTSDDDKPAKKSKKPNKKQVEDDSNDEESTNDYEEMSPKELYMECLERGLEAKKKQKAKYYIDLLEKDDDKGDNDDWEEEDDEDDDGEW